MITTQAHTNIHVTVIEYKIYCLLFHISAKTKQKRKLQAIKNNNKNLKKKKRGGGGCKEKKERNENAEEKIKNKRPWCQQ